MSRVKRCEISTTIQRHFMWKAYEIWHLFLICLLPSKKYVLITGLSRAQLWPGNINWVTVNLYRISENSGLIFLEDFKWIYGKMFFFLKIVQVLVSFQTKKILPTFSSSLVASWTMQTEPSRCVVSIQDDPRPFQYIFLGKTRIIAFLPLFH